MKEFSQKLKDAAENSSRNVPAKIEHAGALYPVRDSEMVETFDPFRPWQDDFDVFLICKEHEESIKDRQTASSTKTLTHVTSSGRASMVDVGHKPVTARTAKAEGVVIVNDEIMKLLQENQIKKGDVLTVAQVAGIMAAKRTSDMIPLCHSLNLTDVQVHLSLDTAQRAVIIRSEIKCDAKTGAEMEALTAVCLAALTVYDMCKAVSKDIRIANVRLVSKTGGKSDYKNGLYSSIAFVED